MEHILLNEIAEDLGIIRYNGENEISFVSRVVYSAMACWIKAISLDRPEGDMEKDGGISKKHILERSEATLQAILSIYPDAREWFLSEDEEPAVNTIRSRLLSHGDLIDVGFGTNVSLCKKHNERISSDIVVEYGSILDEGIMYSGIATIVLLHDKYDIKPYISVSEWYQRFIKEIAWFKSDPISGDIQYYDPYGQSRNNYSLWKDIKPRSINGICLIRRMHIKGYEYFLVKDEGAFYYQIDPFLVEMGTHIRIMLAYRSFAKNTIQADLQEYNDHMKLSLNCLLPFNERKLLETYAWPVNNINDRLTWVMPIDIWHMIEPSITSLHIHVRRVNNG